VQFIINTKSGHVIVEREDVIIPDYEIGQRVVYFDKRKIEIEAHIVGVYVSNVLIEDTYESEVLYQLDNGDTVLEPDIEKYYEMEDE